MPFVTRILNNNKILEHFLNANKPYIVAKGVYSRLMEHLNQDTKTIDNITEHSNWLYKIYRHQIHSDPLDLSTVETKDLLYIKLVFDDNFFLRDGLLLRMLEDLNDHIFGLFPIIANRKLNTHYNLSIVLFVNQEILRRTTADEKKSVNVQSSVDIKLHNIVGTVLKYNLPIVKIQKDEHDKSFELKNRPFCTHCLKQVDKCDAKTVSRKIDNVMPNSIYHLDCMFEIFNTPVNESKEVILLPEMLPPPLPEMLPPPFPDMLPPPFPDMLPPPLPYMCVICYGFISPNDKYEPIYHTCGLFNNEMNHHSLCYWDRIKCVCGRDHEVIIVEDLQEDEEWPDFD